MESANVVVDDQGTIFIAPRSDESEIEGPLHASRDDASSNDATLGNSSSPDTEDASSVFESLSQPEDPSASSVESNREASKLVKKDHSTIDIIGDPKEGVQTIGNSKVNYKEWGGGGGGVGYTCYTSSIEPKNIKEALEDEYWLTTM